MAANGPGAGSFLAEPRPARAENESGKIGAKAVEAIRGGWYLGEEGFKDKLLGISMYLALENGVWKLGGIVVKDPKNPQYLHTLTRLLEVKTFENNQVIKGWHSVLE